MFFGLPPRATAAATRPQATITELAHIPPEVPDGLYLLEIQTPGNCRRRRAQQTTPVPNMKPTLESARARDEADELRSFREQFAIPTNSRGQQQLYLCGHSLGLMPLAARQLVDQELDDWARLAVWATSRARAPGFRITRI